MRRSSKPFSNFTKVVTFIIHRNRYLDALHYSIDGNFHFNLKLKHTDPKDFPLTKGAAYFVHEDDFKKYIAKAPPPKHEVGDFCAAGGLRS